MAEVLFRDEIDFSAYERQTECKAKVRAAADFLEDLVAQFAPKDRAKAAPEMFSTRLRGLVQFRPGEVTAWAGYNGHRKSMLTGQLALDLCVQRQRVLIVSPEMQPDRTLARMVRQASGMATPTRTFIDGFTRWSDGRLWLFDHMGRINPTLCLAVLRYFADELKGQHVFIDSMMMICASEEHLDEQKQFVTDLVRTAQETGLHVHLVAHCRKPQIGEDKPPTKYDIRGSSAITDQAPNVVLVWANKGKQAALDRDPSDEAELAKPDALVIVDKQRNGEFEGKVKLWFDPASLRFMDDRMSPVEPYAFTQGEFA